MMLKETYLCFVILFYLVRAAGYRAVVASAPAPTDGVEAPAARAHGSRFERYDGVLVQHLWKCMDSVPWYLVPCSADSWRLPVWRRHEYKPTFLGTRRHYPGRPTFSTLFLNLLLGACNFYSTPFPSVL